MKLMTVVAIATIGVCSSALGQANKQGGNVEETIMRIEKEMLGALLKGDASASQRYNSETIVFTGPDGEFMNKAQLVADIKSGTLKLTSATLDDAKVHVYKDTAVVTYSSNDKGTYKGKDISGKTRWTDVFVNRNGQWQVVAVHGSRVAK